MCYLVSILPLSMPDRAAQAGKAALATETALQLAYCIYYTLHNSHLSISWGPELGTVQSRLPVRGERLEEEPTVSRGALLGEQVSCNWKEEELEKEGRKKQCSCHQKDKEQ